MRGVLIWSGRSVIVALGVLEYWFAQTHLASAVGGFAVGVMVMSAIIDLDDLIEAALAKRDMKP